MGADFGEKPVGFLLIAEDVPVEQAGIPVDQHIADIEDDRVYTAWHDGTCVNRVNGKMPDTPGL
ncbi:hypothetical protein GCM10007285_16950 [Stappia taiwanensis]|nr:hypothetical protein GCM10007285_16950 [Stappia taiwanensis]